ncbi:protein-L-isoaspartate O-methyltransferase [Streptomyces sp. NPDC101181]|uniref:protein-L-isoaspartate O-methyltransferase family protein n=1 Tax=Streptomyces sp. NPDC101181 TaxID=3366125 RepID=UPI00381873B7
MLSEPTAPAAPLLPAQPGDTFEAAVVRAAMVARLEESGGLGPGPVREALLTLPRQLLMPQAYARRSAPDETPPRWDLLDFSRPADLAELLERLHCVGSVAIQHDGEPILGRVPGPRRRGAITAMSSTMSVTVGLLQQLDLRPGQRVLDVGTGPGVTAAACFMCGGEGVVTLDIDRHVTAAAHERLSDLGYRPATVTGDGTTGWADAGPLTGSSSPSTSATCRRPASPNWNSRTSAYACNSRRRTTDCPPHGPRPAS